MRSELGAVRGESLLRLDRPAEALEAFDRIVDADSKGPHAAQALFGAAAALDRLGRADEARARRERLASSFPGTPWARRAIAEERAQTDVPPRTRR
jgi:TolA-binding protein